MQQKNPDIIEVPARDPMVGFDLRTHIRDAKTNKLVKVQPYLRHSSRDGGVVYERDGKFFYENGETAEGWVPKAAAPVQAQAAAPAVMASSNPKPQAQVK